MTLRRRQLRVKRALPHRHDDRLSAALVRRSGARRRRHADAATDRCDQLDDPWSDRAIPVRFGGEPESLAAAIAACSRERPDAIVAVGDRPAVLAAHLTAPWAEGNPVAAAARSRNKLQTREAFSAPDYRHRTLRSSRCTTTRSCWPARPCTRRFSNRWRWEAVASCASTTARSSPTRSDGCGRSWCRPTFASSATPHTTRR